MNGRFNTLQAAVLLAVLPYSEWEVGERARIGLHYNEHLREFCGVPEIRPSNTHVFAQYTIRVPRREIFIERVTAMKVPAAAHFTKCLNEQPVFSSLGYQLADFPEAEKASRAVISLHMHPFLAKSDQDLVISAVNSCLH